MKITRINTQTARIQAPFTAIKPLLLDQNHYYPPSDPLAVNEQCAFTHAKLYYKGGGWWLLAGYDSDGRDVQRVLDRMQEHHVPHVVRSFRPALAVPLPIIKQMFLACLVAPRIGPIYSVNMDTTPTDQESAYETFTEPFLLNYEPPFLPETVDFIPCYFMMQEYAQFCCALRDGVVDPPFSLHPKTTSWLIEYRPYNPANPNPASTT